MKIDIILLGLQIGLLTNFAIEGNILWSCISGAFIYFIHLPAVRRKGG